MNNRLLESFEELLKTYYGGPPVHSRRNVNDVNELFSYYYGKPVKPERHHGQHDRHDHHRHKHHPTSLFHVDDGETLVQHAGSSEYVVGSPASEQSLQEYVVPTATFSERHRSSSGVLSLSIGAAAPAQECGVDVRQPLRQAPPTPSHSLSTARVQPLSLEPDVTVPTAPPYTPPDAPSKPETPEDDFITDIKGILSGQAAYDPVTKKTVPKDKLRAVEQSPNGRQPQTANEQDIFDRIAESMQQASTYDLGTVELQNRFADFDRIYDLQEKATERKKGKHGASYDADTSEFLEDLGAICSGVATAPQYATQTSADKWDRIASEVFGRDSYADFLADLKNCNFLGQTVNNVHDDVVQKLSAVEQNLLKSYGSGYIAPPISSTFRKRAGMHGFGMAIDFDGLHNPYVLNESGEKELDNELVGAYDHIADFVLGKPQSVIRKLKNGRSAFGNGTIADVYDALKEESDAMKHYFSLKDDAALTAFLSQEWPAPHAGKQAPSAADAKAQITEDYEVLGGKTAAGGKRPTGGKGSRPFAPTSAGGVGDPAGGFLNLPREFVIAMTDAGFAWGAIDFGVESGDIMHFDLRLQGNGAKAYNLLLKYK